LTLHISRASPDELRVEEQSYFRVRNLLIGISNMKLSALLTTAALLPSLVHALGIRVLDQDAAATARGNAFVATADNPSAIYYNPAGLNQLEAQNLRLGAYAVDVQVDYKPETGGHVENEQEFQGLPQLYYAWKPKNYPVALGLGVYSPFGLGLEYPDDSPFRTLAKRGRIAFLTVSPAASIEVTKGLSIGIAPTINYADAELSRGISGAGDDFRFRGAGTAIGVNAGILWKPNEMHAFGLTYRSATQIDLSGHSRVRLSDAQQKEIRTANEQLAAIPVPVRAALELPTEPIPTEFAEEDANATFQFPQSIAFGYSFRPTPDWNFEINVDWTDWDSLNTVTLNQRSGDVALPFNWESSFIYSFGATRSFNNGFHLSAGYMFVENSVPDSDFNPAVPDSDHHVFSAGIGQKYRQYTWDLSYQITHGPTRTIDNGTAADGRFRFLSHALSFSLGYNF
jgi:long-chain fatty acid transport protein